MLPLSCDVIFCCRAASPRAERSLRSVLEQEGLDLVVHLIDDGGGARELLERHARRWNVRPHRNASPRGAFETLHEILSELTSPFVAIQDPETESLPGRLRAALDRLQLGGAELLGAGLVTASGSLAAEVPGAPYRTYLPAPTLVVRRATLADMGGFAARDGDEGAELVYRAHGEGRLILAHPEPTVRAFDGWRPEKLGATPRYDLRGGSLRHHARGFPRNGSARCDVVLPFHGHLDYVEEALQSVLAQESCEVVIHLIDDASPGDPVELLRHWARDPRVRAYRNKRNLGQFVSFNNVAAYFETPFVAVQDADDLSEPDRLRRSIEILECADADIFGAATVPFGEEEAGFPEPLPSRYPSPERMDFLRNPTAVLRSDFFVSTGGFSDFNTTLRNRCGLDTEFYARSYHSGGRFAISRSQLVRYRIHEDQATRNRLTGWSTVPRRETFEECSRRLRSWKQRRFDPRSYGALRRHVELTQRFAP